jgi:hypothetical protein
MLCSLADLMTDRHVQQRRVGRGRGRDDKGMQRQARSDWLYARNSSRSGMPPMLLSVVARSCHFHQTKPKPTRSFSLGFLSDTSLQLPNREQTPTRFAVS